jgi:hypothetical protein
VHCRRRPLAAAAAAAATSTHHGARHPAVRHPVYYTERTAWHQPRGAPSLPTTPVLPFTRYARATPSTRIYPGHGAARPSGVPDALSPSEMCRCLWYSPLSGLALSSCSSSWQSTACPPSHHPLSSPSPRRSHPLPARPPLTIHIPQAAPRDSGFRRRLRLRELASHARSVCSSSIVMCIKP